MKPAINGTEEDFAEFEGSIATDYLENYPFYDDFWKAKAAKVDEITVPMLVCASFSDHGLHTMGSFRAFEKATVAAQVGVHASHRQVGRLLLAGGARDDQGLHGLFPEG